MSGYTETGLRVERSLGYKASCRMRYDIGDELKKPGGVVTCQVNGTVSVDAGEASYGPVTGQITLVNTGSVVEATGSLQTMAELPCSRCLARHQVPIQVEVDEVCSLAPVDQYQPVAAEDGEGEIIPLAAGSQVDLSELVRQLLVLDTPWRSVCRLDCQGLCPNCGQNLNEGDCDCQRQQIDPRLAPLQGLRQ